MRTPPRKDIRLDSFILITFISFAILACYGGLCALHFTPSTLWVTLPSGFMYGTWLLFTLLVSEIR